MGYNWQNLHRDLIGRKMLLLSIHLLKYLLIIPDKVRTKGAPRDDLCTYFEGTLMS